MKDMRCCGKVNTDAAEDPFDGSCGSDGRGFHMGMFNSIQAGALVITPDMDWKAHS